MNMIRLFYAIIIMFSYPLECFVCREVVENTLFAARKGDKVLHTGITVFMVLVAMLLSFTTDCLGVVLELNVIIIIITLFSGCLTILKFISKGITCCHFTCLHIAVYLYRPDHLQSGEKAKLGAGADRTRSCRLFCSRRWASLGDRQDRQRLRVLTRQRARLLLVVSCIHAIHQC